MPSIVANPQKELIKVLESAAMYNDKGFMWSGHNEAKSAKLRSEFQAQLNELAARIGPDALGAELSKAIESGNAAHDASGTFVTIAKQHFIASNEL